MRLGPDDGVGPGSVGGDPPQFPPNTSRGAVAGRREGFREAVPMQRYEAASGNGRPPAPAESIGARSELDALRVACRRQAHVIELLTAVASNLRGGGAALSAENAELRSANERLGRQRGDGAARGEGALDVRLPLDARAPGAARIVVGRLRGRVPALVLEDALLVVSELVTNSVCHSGASDGAVVVLRVDLTGTLVRLEVEDPGRGGVIAPRAADLDGGFGLNLVQGLSERWGLSAWPRAARACGRISRARPRRHLRRRPTAGPREITSRWNARQRASDRARADAHARRTMTEARPQGDRLHERQPRRSRPRRRGLRARTRAPRCALASRGRRPAAVRRPQTPSCRSGRRRAGTSRRRRLDRRLFPTGTP